MTHPLTNHDWTKIMNGKFYFCSHSGSTVNICRVCSPFQSWSSRCWLLFHSKTWMLLFYFNSLNSKYKSPKISLERNNFRLNITEWEREGNTCATNVKFNTKLRTLSVNSELWIVITNLIFASIVNRFSSKIINAHTAPYSVCVVETSNSHLSSNSHWFDPESYKIVVLFVVQSYTTSNRRAFARARARARSRSICYLNLKFLLLLLLVLASWNRNIHKQTKMRSFKMIDTIFANCARWSLPVAWSNTFSCYKQSKWKERI